MFDISEQHNRTLLTHEADGGCTVLLSGRRDVLRTLALLFGRARAPCIATLSIKLAFASLTLSGLDVRQPIAAAREESCFLAAGGCAPSRGIHLEDPGR